MSEERAFAPEYIGFWSRFLAFLIDSLAVAVSLAIILIPLFGVDWIFTANTLGTDANPTSLIQTVVGAIFVLGFWFFISTTPGKLVLNAYIADADTFTRPKPWQLIVRYLGYYLCIFTLFIGFAWVGFDRRKQGLHDKLARTVVIRGKPLPDNEGA